MENTQKVSLEGMKEIYDIACVEWKKTIRQWTNPFEDTELTEEQVNKMYIAADDSQKKVLNKYLNRISSILAKKAKEEVAKLVLPYQEPSTKQQKSINASVKLFTITEVYNEGKKLDWTNSNQYKYFIYKYFSGGVWCVDAGSPYYLAAVPLGLYFYSRELAEDVIKNFPEIIDDYFMI